MLKKLEEKLIQKTNELKSLNEDLLNCKEGDESIVSDLENAISLLENEIEIIKEKISQKVVVSEDNKNSLRNSMDNARELLKFLGVDYTPKSEIFSESQNKKDEASGEHLIDKYEEALKNTITEPVKASNEEVKQEKKICPTTLEYLEKAKKQFASIEEARKEKEKQYGGNIQPDFPMDEEDFAPVKPVTKKDVLAKLMKSKKEEKINEVPTPKTPTTIATPVLEKVEPKVEVTETTEEIKVEFDKDNFSLKNIYGESTIPEYLNDEYVIKGLEKFYEKDDTTVKLKIRLDLLKNHYEKTMLATGMPKDLFEKLILVISPRISINRGEEIEAGNDMITDGGNSILLECTKYIDPLIIVNMLKVSYHAHVMLLKKKFPKNVSFNSIWENEESLKYLRNKAGESMMIWLSNEKK